MRSNSFSDKVDKWQSVVQNAQEALPGMPWMEAPLADLKQNVEALRSAHDSVLAMSGKQHEAVVQRRKLSAETRKSVRRLAAVARGNLGFDNPLLDSFGVRSEDEARRARKASKATPPPAPAPEV